MFLVIFILLLSVRIPGVAQDFGAVAGRKILLDPGHAVCNLSGKIINPGAAGRISLERDIALQLSEILGQILSDNGARVYFTRQTTNPWRIARSVDEDNRRRAEEANNLGVDVFLRLHCDWSRNKKLFGVVTYYYHRSDLSLARVVQQELEKEFFQDFSRNFSGKPEFAVRKKYLVGFYYSRVPTILIETGYLTNPDQERWLQSKENLFRLARTIGRGLNQYFLTKGKG